MAVVGFVVEEDLITAVPSSEGASAIKFGDDFEQNVQKVAAECGCLLLATFDASAVTVINRLQQMQLKEEISRLRGHSQVNQEVLDGLRDLIRQAGSCSSGYIKFVGVKKNH